jgi:sulfonate transport system substrate-binding protein
MLLRDLEKHGFTEKDFELLDFENAAGIHASLLAGETDACYMSRPFDQVARGVLRVIHDAAQGTETGAEQNPDMGPRAAGVFWVSEEFETRHPVIVQRVVNVIVRTAAWNSDERNRDAIFELREKIGWSREEFERAWAARPLRERYSPHLDEGFFAALRRSVGNAKRFGFMPADAEVSIDDWVEPKYLRRALVEMNL